MAKNGCWEDKKRDSKDLAQSTSITARPERQVQTAKHPLKRAARTAEGETTIRNMLRYIFARHSVFIIKATYFPVYKNNTTNNVKNTTELKNIYSMNKYLNKWLRKNTQW